MTLLNNLLRVAGIWLGIFTLAGCATSGQETARADRGRVLIGTRATFCSAPRLPNGRVDVDRLVSELVEIHANTYSFCIHPAATDWEDLKVFLPKARAAGIRVWASIVPPSESPPHSKLYSEPFQLDYGRWAIEIAQLSRHEPNLVAWSIDDFTHNLKFYTPDRLKNMLDDARRINPRLAFVPCCYFRAITPSFAANYVPLLDGMLFPFRDESGGANLTNAASVPAEVKRIKELVGPTFPIIVDIYASSHSKLGATTPLYVEQAMTSAKQCAEGVMVYRHQNPRVNAEKFQIVKRLFRSWEEGPDRSVTPR